jgi:hypothetical protein
MKKIILSVTACLLFAGTSVANVASASALVVKEKSSSEMRGLERGKRSKKVTRTDEADRRFHVVPVAGEKNKVVVMIGKKANTKVSIRIYDQNGILVYNESRKATQDFATLLNLESVEGAVVKLSDNQGFEKKYTL